ncbi:MAG TPA: hypothetical protein VM716_02480 [Gemmatimonadales bacterium]|nr:hypothetical protein [Gemmatimonadales bacterium]
MELNPSGRLLSGHVGWMWNLSERAAFGATVFLGYGDKADGYGLQPRVRLRMTRTFSVDLAPGFVQHIHSGGGRTGFAGQASLNYDDWLAITAQAVSVGPASPSSAGRLAWYGGARLGSYPGVIISAAAALIFGLSVLISPPTKT